MNKNTTPNEWLKKLMSEANLSGKPDDVPEGWMTLAQMATQAGVVDTTMRARVTKWIMNGLIQKKRFRIRAGRQVTEVWHYNKID